MNVLLATSRGRKLDIKSSWSTRIFIKGGAKVDRLMSEGASILRDLPHDRDSPTFVYMIAGLPDTTHIARDSFFMNGRTRRYEEVVFLETPEQALSRMEKIIDNASFTIKSLDAIPVFATITPISIAHWNNIRLSQHKTSHLKYFHSYPTMQDNLEQALILINKKIHSINSENAVITPKLSKEIFYKRKGVWRARYGKLTDGVHPNDKLAKTWSQIVKDIMRQNEQKFYSDLARLRHNLPELEQAAAKSSDSDSDNEKRSWMY